MVFGCAIVGKQEMTLKKPDVVATIEILRFQSGQPGVRLCASDEFMDVSPVDRAILIAAAIQVCGAAIEAICQDYPNDQDEIREKLSAVMIEPQSRHLN